MHEKKPHNPFSVGETQELTAPSPIETSTAIGAVATQGADVNVEQATNEINTHSADHITDQPPAPHIGRFRMLVYRFGIGAMGQLPGAPGGP